MRKLNNFLIIKKSFWDFYDNLGVALLVNIVWLVLSLPIITLPFTFIGLFGVSYKIAKRDKVLLRDFFSSIKRLFKAGIFLEILFLFLFWLPFFNIVVIAPAMGKGEGLLVLLFSVFFLALFTLVSLYFFPLLLADNGFTNSFKYAIFFVRDNARFTILLLMQIFVLLFVFIISGFGIILLSGIVVTIFLQNVLQELVAKYKQDQVVDYSEYEKRSLREIFLFWKES